MSDCAGGALREAEPGGRRSLWEAEPDGRRGLTGGGLTGGLCVCVCVASVGGAAVVGDVLQAAEQGGVVVRTNPLGRRLLL